MIVYDNHTRVPTGNKNPLVTLVVLFYNHIRFVDEAVGAALDQDYPCCEILLTDDCSTDGTGHRLVELAKAYSGPHRVIVNINERNLGIGGHLQEITPLCHGEWIVTQGGDDISDVDRVSVTMRYANLNPSTSAIGVGAIEIDENGRPQRESRTVDRVYVYHRYREGLFSFDMRPGATVPLVVIVGAMAAYRRDVWCLAPIPQDIVAEDVFLSHRAILLGDVAFLPGHYVRQRFSAQSISRAGCKSQLRCERRAARRRISRMVYLSFDALCRECENYAIEVPCGYKKFISQKKCDLLLQCFPLGSVSTLTADNYAIALILSQKGFWRLLNEALARGVLRELLKLYLWQSRRAIIDWCRTILYLTNKGKSS